MSNETPLAVITTEAEADAVPLMTVVLSWVMEGPNAIQLAYQRNTWGTWNAAGGTDHHDYPPLPAIVLAPISGDAAEVRARTLSEAANIASDSFSAIAYATDKRKKATYLDGVHAAIGHITARLHTAARHPEESTDE